MRQPAAFFGIRFALRGVVKGGGHVCVGELTIHVGHGQAQRSVVQLQCSVDETAVGVGGRHVVDHLVVARLVGQPIEDVHGFGEDVGGLGEAVGASVVIDDHAEGIGQFRQMALRPCLLRNYPCQRCSFLVALHREQAARLPDP